MAKVINNHPETVIRLLFGSLPRFTSVRLTAQTWFDRPLWQAAHQRWAQLQPPGSVVQLTAKNAPPHDPDRLVIEQQQLWLQPPDRWREEVPHRSTTVVHGQQRRVFGLLHKKVVQERIYPTQGWPHLLRDRALAEMLEPAGLLPALWIVSATEKSHLSRPAFQVKATPRLPGAPEYPPSLWIGADEYHLVLDADRGVVLSLSALLEGIEFAAREILEIEFDETFADDLFQVA